MNKYQERYEQVRCFLKSSFPDERSAIIRLRWLKRGKKTKESFQNGGAYECPHCGMWHITKNLQDRNQEKEENNLQLEAEYWKERIR